MGWRWRVAGGVGLWKKRERGHIFVKLPVRPLSSPLTAKNIWPRQKKFAAAKLPNCRGKKHFSTAFDTNNNFCRGKKNCHSKKYFAAAKFFCRLGGCFCRWGGRAVIPPFSLLPGRGRGRGMGRPLGIVRLLRAISAHCARAPHS